ncbi:MAG: metallophosphoesterase family protein [Verrucomicrobiota bacterium]
MKVSVSQYLRGCLLLFTAASLHAAQIVRGPYLQSPASGRMTLCWRTDVATTSEVMLGASPDSLNLPASVAGTRTDHVVTITGLAASTRYFYRIAGTPLSGTPVNTWGPDYWFRTAPPSGQPQPVRIFVAGDGGYPNQQSISAFNSYQTATSSAGKKTDVFIMLGDNAYDIGTDAQHQYPVFDRYANLLRNTPVWSAFGNHDGYSVPPPYSAPVPYDTIFQFPLNGESGGFASGTRRYYSFDQGNVHFISVDTNTLGNYDDVPGGNYGMVDWLLDDLKACTADWIIAYMHQGPYSKGSHNSDVELELVRSRDYVIPLLESYGADLILYGHSHCYERSRLMDGHYAVSSSWNTATMQKWPGNGSDLGGVDVTGNFIKSPAAAGGAFQKPAALSHAGTIYSVVGASSSAQSWLNGSSALVNPSPHPAHQVSLSLIGNLVVEIHGQKLNGQYIDQSGNVRDDFTILKGATYTIHGAAPTSEGALNGLAFPVTRTGSTAFAEQVPVGVNLISGAGSAPSQGAAIFAAGQVSTLVKFFPQAGSSSIRFGASLLATTRPVQDGESRAAYRISGGAQTGQFSTSPAATWYASRFGTEPSDSAVWESDNDGDGLSLLLEYALGGEADRNDSQLLPQGKIEGASFNYRYNRPHGRSDLTYQVLASANLSTWPLPGPADIADGPVTALGEPRRVTLPIGNPLKFVKLKVELQP